MKGKYFKKISFFFKAQLRQQNIKRCLKFELFLVLIQKVVFFFFFFYLNKFFNFMFKRVSNISKLSILHLIIY